jgi:hypothetical protein
MTHDNSKTNIFEICINLILSNLPTNVVIVKLYQLLLPIVFIKIARQLFNLKWASSLWKHLHEIRLQKCQKIVMVYPVINGMTAILMMYTLDIYHLLHLTT